MTYGLIFFVCLLLLACNHSDETSIKIQWEGKRATGMSIADRLLQAVPADSLDQFVSVRLRGKETSIAGSYRQTDDAIVFEPLIPFTRGLSYEVWLKSNRLGELTIPELANGDNPQLLAIYPSQDSLPDNLLKIYLHFSRPMREGQSQKYVTLLKNNTDTLSGVFLDLQPELWNADRTLLTLWLDPGRIKRDLQPNKRLGAPLQPGLHYQLVVSAAWPDQQGAPLAMSTAKSFLTVQRDSLSPIPARWVLSSPKAGNTQPLDLAFGEALDYSLLTETLHLLTKAGKPVAGTWQLKDEEKQISFRPSSSWQNGEYRLRVEGRLEDLAGNNLNRPFDRDITRKEVRKQSLPFVDIVFVVK